MSRRTDIPLALALAALVGALLCAGEVARVQALRLGAMQRACERDRQRCPEYEAGREAARRPGALVTLGLSLLRGWWEN